jgi:hypothetical protein
MHLFWREGRSRLASYIAKYCGKLMDCRELNQKRYFRSRGIVLPELQYWRLPTAPACSMPSTLHFARLKGILCNIWIRGVTMRWVLCILRLRRGCPQSETFRFEEQNASNKIIAQIAIDFR